MYQKIKTLAALAVIFAFAITGCKNNSSPLSPLTSSPNAQAMLKVHSFNPAHIGSDAVKVKNSGSHTYINFPITSGSLDVQHAYFNFKDLVVEENSGFDGEQTGENNDGANDTLGTTGETPDITVPGPFSVDLSSGTASIGSFDVYPGTFKKVNFKLVPNSADPFWGKTIVISGLYTPQGGSAIPFTLKSDVNSQLQLPLANGGIVATSNSTVSLDIVIDLPVLFNSVDFSTATVSNGQILIDSQNNAALLSSFETNLQKYIDAENGKGGEVGGESEGGEG
jgi:hypothetical protein